LEHLAGFAPFREQDMLVRDADYWIERLGLAEHPEGGYFRRTYRSNEEISLDGLPSRFSGPRAFSTSIYFLLKGGQFSALHRIKSDELWHFYAGSSLTIHAIDQVGGLTRMKLGSDLENGEAFQRLVAARCWFGATVDDPASYSLVGCTVAPGFDFQDFELGNRKALTDQYPQHRSVIERLTR
jgi:hypothetical protein